MSLQSYSLTDTNIPFQIKLARLVSDVFNPLLLPSLFIIIISWLLSFNSKQFYWISATTLLFYTLIPVTTIYLLYRRNVIQHIDLHDQKTRHLPYLLVCLSYSGGGFLLGLLTLDANLLIVMLAIIFVFNSLIGFLLNLKWKVSVHTATLSTGISIFFLLGPMQFLPYYSVFAVSIFGILLLLLPLMMWARFTLRVHSIGELVAGFFSGLVLTFIELILMLNL